MILKSEKSSETLGGNVKIPPGLCNLWFQCVACSANCYHNTGQAKREWVLELNSPSLKPLVEFRAIYDKFHYNNKYKENVIRQSYFRVSCSWPIETVPYWYDHNKYYTMNKHEHRVLALWGPRSHSYCFMGELHCIQFTLRKGEQSSTDTLFETFWCSKFQPPTRQ